MRTVRIPPRTSSFTSPPAGPALNTVYSLRPVRGQHHQQGQRSRHCQRRPPGRPAHPLPAAGSTGSIRMAAAESLPLSVRIGSCGMTACQRLAAVKQVAAGCHTLPVGQQFLQFFLGEAPGMLQGIQRTLHSVFVLFHIHRSIVFCIPITFHPSFRVPSPAVFLRIPVLPAASAGPSRCVSSPRRA